MDSLNRIARLAGVGYLVIFVSGIFANFFVLESLVVPGDATATAANIIDYDFQFRIGLLSFFIMVIFDLLLVWALYLLFVPVNRDLSLLSAWLRLVNVAIFGVALYHLFVVLQLVSGAEYLNVFEPARLHAEIMLSIEAFNATWLVGLVFFGLHLIVLGYLIFKSGFIPRFIGVLLVIAAVGYLVDSFANFLLPNYDDYAMVFLAMVAIPGIVGELSLTLWLLIKGVSGSSAKAAEV
jgi:hypothetical protein